MKTSVNGIGMVAVALGAIAFMPACSNEEGMDTTALKDPTAAFAAPQGTTGDTTKACPTRPDLASSFSLANGSFGSWQACYQLCPAGSFAYGTYLRSEVSQGGGDDSALNAIQLDCYNKTTGAYTGFITSQIGPWGTWGARAVTNPYVVGNPIIGGQMKVEGPQGLGDDTAANAVVLRALNGTNSTPPVNTSWGSWQPLRTCAAGQAVCGVNTRVEGSQGVGDDSSLNGIAFACCSF
jgi:hypothetical protein